MPPPLNKPCLRTLIDKLRRKLRLSVEGLATECGLGKATIDRALAKRRPLASDDTLEALVKVFQKVQPGLTIEDLLPGPEALGHSAEDVRVLADFCPEFPQHHSSV